MFSTPFPHSAPTVRGVLVPLDGSELAEQALAVGGARARRTGATLHLVSVHEPLPAMAMPPDVAMPTHELERDAVLERRQYVDSVAAGVRTTLQSPVVTAVPAGDAATELSRYIETHEVDLVVMTTHGRTGMSRLWLGSVADRLLRRVEVPVLLLHPSEAPQPAEFRHLVVALDGTIEKPVFDAIAALGARPGATRCILTRVVEPTTLVPSNLAMRPARIPPEWTTQREIDARHYLSRLAETMARAGWDVDWQVLVGRGVAGQVLALAQASSADCIVAGTHGARGVERLLLGSVADKIVRGAKVPVLVSPVGHREVQAAAAAAHAEARGLIDLAPAATA